MGDFTKLEEVQILFKGELDANDDNAELGIAV
jgi:hypothetical protein